MHLTHLVGLQRFTDGRWIALVLLAIGFWPVARDWEERLSPENLALRLENRRDMIALHDMAGHIRALAQKHHTTLPILAPWWFSPALAYWSGQPCVAGSSHQSLPGTVDTARFYTAQQPQAARELLARREVALVVAYAPERVLSTSATLLGLPSLSHAETTMAYLLYTRPNQPPPGLIPAGRNRSFVLMAVEQPLR